MQTPPSTSKAARLRRKRPKPERIRKRKRGDRGFDEIPLQAAGYHHCSQHRFNPTSSTTFKTPYLNSWRNNLTALARTHNLYVVASEANLLLYTPTGPSHFVPGQPICRIELPRTRPSRPGAMPMANPHSVNHVIVDSLGQDEVVLCACDDGDVVGYYVRDLWREVEETWELKKAADKEMQAKERELVAEERRTRRDEERLRREVLGLDGKEVVDHVDDKTSRGISARFKSFEGLRTQLKPPITEPPIETRTQLSKAADAHRLRPQHALVEEDALARASRLTREHDDLEAERRQPDAEHQKTQIRPCFHENARLSAWGLAVHSEARLIAVSSNSTKITVWALALTKAPKLSDEDHEQDKLIARDVQEPAGLKYRAVSHKYLHQRPQPQEDEEEGLHNPDILYSYKFKAQLSMRPLRELQSQERRLKGHTTNIPAIAFCNTPEDPTGKYLASTDINGTTMIWDVDRAIPVRLMIPSRLPEEHRDGAEYDTSRDGWGVAFLDPRSFKPTKSVVEATGTCSSMSKVVSSRGAYMPVLQHLRNRKVTLWDTSESQCMVKDTGAWDLQGTRTKRMRRPQHNHYYNAHPSQGISSGLNAGVPETNNIGLMDQLLANMQAHVAANQGTPQEATTAVQDDFVSTSPDSDHGWVNAYTAATQGATIPMQGVEASTASNTLPPAPAQAHVASAQGPTTQTEGNDESTTSDIEPPAPTQAHGAATQGATTPMQNYYDSTASDSEPDTSFLEAAHASDASTPLLSPPDTPNKRPKTLARVTYRNNLAGKIPSDTLASSIDPLELRGSRWPLFTYHSCHAGHSHQPDLAAAFIPTEYEMPKVPLALLNPRAIHLFQSPSLLNPPNGIPRIAQNVHNYLPPAWGSFADCMLHPVEPADPSPTIFIDDPLAQDVDSIASVVNGHDRMNLMAQIPELGVLLVGSPKGRVGVFTLHTLVPDYSKQLNDVQEEVRTMRLDWLLPFKSQEEEEMRPLQQLVGLSVGPVFRTGGSDQAGDGRRRRGWLDGGKCGDNTEDGEGDGGQKGEIVDGVWRVLMLYRNHTILAYEIRRPGFGVLDDPATGVSCRE